MLNGFLGNRVSKRKTNDGRSRVFIILELVFRRLGGSIAPLDAYDNDYRAVLADTSVAVGPVDVQPACWSRASVLRRMVQL